MLHESGTPGPHVRKSWSSSNGAVRVEKWPFTLKRSTSNGEILRAGGQPEMVSALHRCSSTGDLPMSRAGFASKQAPFEHFLSRQIDLVCSWMLSCSTEMEICFYAFLYVSFNFFLYSQIHLQDGER